MSQKAAWNQAFSGFPHHKAPAVSSQGRYDHFDTLPYFLMLCSCRILGKVVLQQAGKRLNRSLTAQQNVSSEEVAIVSMYRVLGPHRWIEKSRLKVPCGIAICFIITECRGKSNAEFIRKRFTELASYADCTHLPAVSFQSETVGGPIEEKIHPRVCMQTIKITKTGPQQGE